MISSNFEKIYTVGKLAVNFQKPTKILRKTFVSLIFFNFSKNFFGHMLDHDGTHLSILHNIFVTWTTQWIWVFFWICTFWGHDFSKYHNFYSFCPRSKIFSDLMRTWFVLQNVRISSNIRFLMRTHHLLDRASNC